MFYALGAASGCGNKMLGGTAPREATEKSGEDTNARLYITGTIGPLTRQIGVGGKTRGLYHV
jgi:hypothetical protein